MAQFVEWCANAAAIVVVIAIGAVFAQMLWSSDPGPDDDDERY